MSSIYFLCSVDSNLKNPEYSPIFSNVLNLHRSKSQNILFKLFNINLLWSLHSPVLENRKTTNIRHSTLQPPHIYYKTSQNNRNNQNDSLMLTVYKLWVLSGIFPLCYHLLVGWNRNNIWTLEDVPLYQFKLPDTVVKAQLHYTTACDNTSLYWRHKVKVNFDVVNWDTLHNALLINSTSLSLQEMTNKGQTKMLTHPPKQIQLTEASLCQMLNM